MCWIKCLIRGRKKEWGMSHQTQLFPQKTSVTWNLVEDKTSGLNPHQIFHFHLKVCCWLRHGYRSKDTHCSWPNNKASADEGQVLHLIFKQNLSWVLVEDRVPTEYKNIAETPQNSPVTSSDLIRSDTLPGFGEGDRGVGCNLTFFWLQEASCSHKKQYSMNKLLQRDFSFDPVDYAAYHSA